MKCLFNTYVNSRVLIFKQTHATYVSHDKGIAYHSVPKYRIVCILIDIPKCPYISVHIVLLTDGGSWTGEFPPFWFYVDCIARLLFAFWTIFPINTRRRPSLTDFYLKTGDFIRNSVFYYVLSRVQRPESNRVGLALFSECLRSLCERCLDPLFFSPGAHRSNCLLCCHDRRKW